MKILISHCSLYKKAGWGRIFPLAVGLAKQNQYVTIITTNPKFSLMIKKSIENNVNVIIFPEIIPSRISTLGFGFLSLILKIIYVLFNKYDIVHSDNGHRPLSGIPCRIHKKRFDSIYVAEWYDWYGKGGQYDSKPKIFKRILGPYELKYEIKDKRIADGVVVLSEILRKRAENLKPKERIIKIHGGADISNIPFLCDNSALKEKYNIGRNTLTLGYISSKSYNLPELLPLINAIKNKTISTKIKILVFGDVNKKVYDLPDNILRLINFFGWINYEFDYEKLQCVDVFFLLKVEMLVSKAGWPNCIGDYLACGRPVLLNPVGEVVDFVKKYPFAFIQTSRNESELYSKVEYLLNNQQNIMKERIKIRRLAEEEISWDRKSLDLFKFYSYLLNKRNLIC
ncbi:MAG: glycosyltransferase [Bacteroidales bacterium]|nr:glycosyltransferase [Bacteroidales bacterium]